MLILVGAGPGDPELITIKGLKAIQSADIILYDSLVNPKIFDLAFPGTSPELVFVGKRKGRESITQDDINTLILNNLRAGKTVARLKGGDPFIFARGVEELEIAKAHGYDYQIIPGLTSGLAVPVSKGITLTMRGLSDSVTLVTGHEINDLKINNWTNLLETGSTLVIYMGLSNLVKIIEGIKNKSKDKLTAIAICNGTLEEEKCVISDLENLAQDVINANIKSPTILIFGKYINGDFLVKNQGFPNKISIKY